MRPAVSNGATEAMEGVELGSGNTEFLAKAADAIHIKLVSTQEDVDEGESFHPEFTHQVVGQSEMIFGFKDLQIECLYSSSSMLPCISCTYSTKTESQETPADDINAMFREWVPEECLFSKEQFAMRLDEEAQFKPVGELVNVKTSKGRALEVYLSTPATPDVATYHRRLEIFAIWCIEGGSYIDMEDDRWRIFTMYEKDESGGEPSYHVRGFITVYMYYAYPEHYRPRISQMVILPPYQRSGLGSILLQTVYDRLRATPNVVDISVEDPSDNFMQLRDYVDCKACIVANVDVNVGTFADFAEIAKSKFKLTKNQIRRVYEILKLRAVNRTSEAQQRAYRLMIKQRLFQPFIKEKRAEEKELAVMAEEEIKIYRQKQQECKAQLQTQYEALENYYTTVLDKLEHL